MYEQQRAGLGDELLEAVGQSLESIALHPLACAIARKDYRRARVRPFPYSVFYKALATEIVVHCVFHNSRKPAAWKRRLKQDE